MTAADESAPNETVASLAVTLDGYVARLDGSVDYLERYPIEEFNFEGFLEGIGAMIMGSASYLQSVEWGWQWSAYPTMVLTTRADLPVPDGADVTFSSQPTAVAIRDFAAKTPKRLWVFGGGDVVTQGMRGGAVDLLDITVMPEAIGSGLPLYTDEYSAPMKVMSTTPYANGALRIVYDLTV